MLILSLNIKKIMDSCIKKKIENTGTAIHIAHCLQSGGCISFTGHYVCHLGHCYIHHKLSLFFMILCFYDFGCFFKTMCSVTHAQKIHHIYVFGKDMNFMSLWLGILYTSSSPIWTYRVKIILCIILIIGDTNIPYIFVLFCFLHSGHLVLRLHTRIWLWCGNVEEFAFWQFYVCSLLYI